MVANPPKSKPTPIRLPNGTLSMPDDLTHPLTDVPQGEEPEYEVEKIVGKSIWSGNGGPNGGRRTKYLIKWVGYDEPQWEFAESGNLANCQEFIDDYERDNTLRVNLLCENMSPSERAVRELIEKNLGLKGSVEDWVLSYDTELTAVTDSRMIELHGEERDIALKSGNLMKLRMLLKRKKCGRLKSRLVAQGFLEAWWLTAGKESSPVLRQESLRALIFGGGIDDEFACIDVSTAFLQASAYTIDDYIRYATYREYRGGPLRVYRLTGPVYGQRDAPRRWYDTVIHTLTTELGFIACPNDPCAFHHPITRVYLGLVVDDILARGPKLELEKFMETFQTKFLCTEPNHLTDDNPIDFSGLRLTRETKSNGQVGYYIDQQGDFDQYLIDNNIDVSRHSGVDCPMPSREALFSNPILLSETDKTYYKSIVGGLSWFAQSTRWDIISSVSRLQMVGQNPTVGALKCALHVVAYLACTNSFKLGGVRTATNHLRYYADSDFAGDRELTKQSRSGGVIFLNNIPIVWISKPQPKTVGSPAEAEIYATKEVVREAQGINWVMRDLGMTGLNLGKTVQGGLGTFSGSPILVQVDNTQVLSFQKDSCVRSRHYGIIDMADTWVSELRDQSKVDTSHIASELNPADIFTKCMPRGVFMSRRALFNQEYTGYAAKAA